MDSPDATTDRQTNSHSSSGAVAFAIQTHDGRLDVDLTAPASDVLATAAAERASWDADHGPTDDAPAELRAVETAARQDETMSLTFFEAQRAADALHWYAGELTRGEHDADRLDTALDVASALRRLVQAADTVA